MTKSIIMQGNSRDCHPKKASLMLLAAVWLLSLVRSGSAATSRDLLSTACTTSIPRCLPNMCTMKKFNANTAPEPFCQRCQNTYISAFGGRACVCAAGRYDADDRCESCGEGHYCPGVTNSVLNFDQNVAANRGPRRPCDKKYGGRALFPHELTDSGLQTGKTRAVEWTECVPKPGYRLASTENIAAQITEDTQTARVCEDNTYSPGGRRIARCLPCPRGLITVGDGPIQRDAANDCKLPPGYYFDRGVGIACPKGTYRSNISEQTNREPCTPCGEGVTTERVASGSRSDCKVVEPGYAVRWNPEGYAEPAGLCPYGSFWPGGLVGGHSLLNGPMNSDGGQCQSCDGYVTRQEGSTTLSDCVAPPGYYVEWGSLRQCPLWVSVWEPLLPYGTYRSGWARTPNGVWACQQCGINMLAEATDTIMVNFGWGDVPLQVAAGPMSCYIEKDWSLTKMPGNNMWKAAPCANNTIGAREKTYGLLAAVVCKPITGECGLNYEYDRENDRCINRAGWGAYERISKECPVGTWAAEGSMEECKSCGEGRSTLESGDASTRDSVTDCFVLPGYGVRNIYHHHDDHLQWFEDPSWLPATDEERARLHVVECPIGRYSTSTGAPSDISGRCLRCPYGSTTADTGAVGLTDCKYCVAGFGMRYSPQEQNETCQPCPRSTYSSGSAMGENNHKQCQSCPMHNYEYSYAEQVKALGYTEEYYGPVHSGSNSVFPQAESEGECLPAVHQLSSFAGTSVMSLEYRSHSHRFLNDYKLQPNLNPQTCALECASRYTCQYAEIHYHNDGAMNTCYLFEPEVNVNGLSHSWVFYKLPPLSDIRIASVKVKSQDATTQTSTNSTISQWFKFFNMSSPMQANAWGPRSASPQNTSTMGPASAMLPQALASWNVSSRPKAKSLSSGIYAHYPIASYYLNDFGPVLLDSTDWYQAFATCDADARCWGVTWDANTYRLATRTGSDPAAVEGGMQRLYVRTIISAAKAYEDPYQHSSVLYVSPSVYY